MAGRLAFCTAEPGGSRNSCNNHNFTCRPSHERTAPAMNTVMAKAGTHGGAVAVRDSHRAEPRATGRARGACRRAPGSRRETGRSPGGDRDPYAVAGHRETADHPRSIATAAGEPTDPVWGRAMGILRERG